jgi:hypothetical protein
MATAAESASPEAFLNAIYRSYLGKDSKGIPLDKPATVRRYFAPPLASAILKDQATAAKRKEVGTLDGDPFIDAQDWEIANLKVEVKNIDAGHATGTVTFINTGKPATMTLNLVKTTAGWRIADIQAPSGSLRKLMKLP